MTAVEDKKAEAIVSAEEHESSSGRGKCKKRSSSNQESKNQFVGGTTTKYQKTTGLSSSDWLINSHNFNINNMEQLQHQYCGSEQLDSKTFPMTLSKKPTDVEREPRKVIIESEENDITKKECNNIALYALSTRSIESHRTAAVAVNSEVAFIGQRQVETMCNNMDRDRNDNNERTADPHSNPENGGDNGSNYIDWSSRTSNLAQEPRPTMRKQIDTAPLPDPDTCPQDMHPDLFLKMIILSRLGYNLEVQSAPSLSIFTEISDDELSSYANDVVTATRENDLETLRQIHESGRSLNCCNRFGESILHMACRRGYTEIVKFMLYEANVSVRIKDDCGRTPFHDACWNRNTNFEILDMLMKEDPLLFLVSDNRGSTAFEYARQEHWPVWRKFLHDRSSYFDDVEDPIAKYFMAKP